MGLFRCPKCDAICHTDEEVCHLCGYRLKPADESKVEEKPKEEAKQETKVSQKVEITSGFSRKSLFNSVSFDENEETSKLKEDPFADLRKKEEKPKEDIFEAYFNQAFENNGAVKEGPAVQEEPIKEDPVLAEVVKEEKTEAKPVEVEVVKTDAVFSMPKEEPKVETTKAEEPKVETPKVEEPNVEAPKVEETKPIVEEKPKVVEEPKIEEKPKPATNPYINSGYKANQSTSSTSSAAKASENVTTGATASTATKKVKQPAWVYEWKYKLQKNKKSSKTWAVVLFILFILSIIILAITSEADKPVGFWIFCCIMFCIGFLIAFVMAIMNAAATIYIKELEGYYIVVYGYSSEYKLIIENQIVDRQSSGKYSSNENVKLTGRLPNKKVVVATIYYQNYCRIIKIELLEDKKK